MQNVTRTSPTYLVLVCSKGRMLQAQTTVYNLKSKAPATYSSYQQL